MRFHGAVLDGTGQAGRVDTPEVGDDTPDAALLALVAGGDGRAPLEELYRRYASRLYGMGLRLLGDPGLAEELVQESFVRVWRCASQFDPERGSVAAFVAALARRIAVDLWRRPSSRRVVPDDAGTCAGRSPLDQVEVVLEALVVQDAMDALSPDHRQVLVLSYAGDLTRAEIARRLNLPVGTVKTRAYYALRALKLALEERGIDG